jgi:uncharacterized protein
MITQSADALIRRLELSRHPEGGWYRETYRSAETIRSHCLPERFGGDRPCCTAIHFLLEQGDISALHRIKSDELWHFHAGAPLAIHVITSDGRYSLLHLGPDLTAGQAFQAVVPAGCWFGAEISGPGAFCLVGCTVAPGFDFADFELGDANELQATYPGLADIIERMTRSR